MQTILRQSCLRDAAVRLKLDSNLIEVFMIFAGMTIVPLALRLAVEMS